MGTATIYDVAALAGLSISTVSRVLNTPDQVSDTTREKVMAAIDQLGYVPKAEARARALQSSRRIGVLTPFFTAPSFVQRLRGIDLALADSNYELMIYTVESLSRLHNYLASLPITGNLDGLIVVSLPLNESNSLRLIERALETVVIETHSIYFSSVEIDDIAGGKMAAEYLIHKGHERIAFMGDIHPPDFAIRPVVDRFQGFQQGMQEANLPLPEDYICSCTYYPEVARQTAYHLLNRSQRPTAIFAAADIQAMAVLKVAREMGLRVPQDVAVLGFDDLDLADYMGLTTIRQPLDDSGVIAVELLLGRMANGERPVQHVRLPLTIVERDTV